MRRSGFPQGEIPGGSFLTVISKSERKAVLESLLWKLLISGKNDRPISLESKPGWVELSERLHQGGTAMKTDGEKFGSFL